MPADPSAAVDPHAGHQMSPAAAAADPHAGHGAATEAPPPPILPPPDEARGGPAHAADTVFAGQMDPSRRELIAMHGGASALQILVDQLETTFSDGEAGFAWNGQLWLGGDIDRFALSTEGEGSFDKGVEQAEVQALWSHALDPWFNLRAGVRQDFGAGFDRTHAVLSLQGLARYWFEVEASLFVSTEGEVTARFEGEYDLRITRFLILQPRVEIELAFQDMPDLRIGSGLSEAALGARLRYDFYPNGGLAVIAPYVGVEYERAFGRTEDDRRAAGEGAGGLRLLLGVRTWF